jgi:hypothetical protein
MSLTVNDFQIQAQNRSLASKIFGSNLELSNSGRRLKAPNRFKNWVVNNFKEHLLRQSNQVKGKNREVRTVFQKALTKKFGRQIGNIMKERMADNDEAGKNLRSRRVKALIQEAQSLKAGNRNHNNTIGQTYVTDPIFKPLYDSIAKDMGIGSRFDMTLQTLSSKEGEALRLDTMNTIRKNGKNGKLLVSEDQANNIASDVIRKRLLEQIPLIKDDSDFELIVGNKKLSAKDLQYVQKQPIHSDSRKAYLDEALKAQTTFENKGLITTLTLTDEPYYGIYDKFCKENNLGTHLDPQLRDPHGGAESPGFKFRQELRNRLLQDPALGNSLYSEKKCRKAIERELYQMMGINLAKNPDLKLFVEQLSPEVISATLNQATRGHAEWGNLDLLRGIADKQMISGRQDFRNAMDGLMSCNAKGLSENILAFSKAGMKLETAHRLFQKPGKEFGNDDRIKLFNGMLQEVAETKSHDEMQAFYNRLTSPAMQNLYGAIEIIGADQTLTTDTERLTLGAGLLRVTEGLQRVEEIIFKEAKILDQERKPLGSQRVTYRNLTEETKANLSRIFGLTVHSSRQIDFNEEKTGEIKGLISGVQLQYES